MQEIKITDKNYPSLLKKIDSPPKKLYLKGKLFKSENCIAVIGSRKCSKEAERITKEIIKKLPDVTIVSGLAKGIDTFAHKEALKENKRTIAVLGTGLNYIYPEENKKLAESIIKKGGCLISELSPNNKGSKKTFPMRNRIISGISKSIIIVEAKKNSGSLITANFAFSQKKKIYVIAGSEGTNKLIKKGAKIIKKPCI